MIPCYNEASSLGPLLREIRALGPGFDPVVVDDGSTDETAAVAAREGVASLRLVVNLGIGGAVQTAIKYALERGYDLSVQLDGDGQHPPDQARLLLESYRASPANLIVGSRFLGGAPGDGFRSTWSRRAGIALVRRAIRLLFGQTITDPTSGLRLMDRAAIRAFAADYPRDFPEPISAALALERGLSVREVPVRMRSRERGTSSIRGLGVLAYMLRVIGYLFLIRIGRHL